jgi:NitT/TauT family transport system substrate-binding protein
MSSGKTVGLAVGIWLIVISLLHATLNLGALDPKKVAVREPFRVGFIPVTCHLTCPVTDFINKQISGSSEFEPVRFQGWPELKEAFISGYLPATFILAPLAMRMREDGVPIKIVYLGHRDGTALVVNRESQIYRIEDLRGKTIAVPSRFSNQKLLAVKALQDHGVPLDQVKHAGGTFQQGGRRDHIRRTIHGTGGNGWLRPRFISDKGCLAGIHFLCVGRPGRCHS